MAKLHPGGKHFNGGPGDGLARTSLTIVYDDDDDDLDLDFLYNITHV